MRTSENKQEQESTSEKPENIREMLKEALIIAWASEGWVFTEREDLPR